MREHQALHALARLLQQEKTVISPWVVEPNEQPVLGPLAAAGPRASGATEEYALVVESVREGYLLHYRRPRILAGLDDDLALLAGDYLYAIGLERLARLGDGAAVRELSDLISLSAALHTEGGADLVPALWLAAAVAIGCGAGEEHEAAKAAARALQPGVAEALWESARAAALEAGVGADLDHAAEAIDLRAPRLADSG